MRHKAGATGPAESLDVVGRAMIDGRWIGGEPGHLESLSVDGRDLDRAIETLWRDLPSSPGGARIWARAFLRPWQALVVRSTELAEIAAAWERPRDGAPLAFDPDFGTRSLEEYGTLLVEHARTVATAPHILPTPVAHGLGAKVVGLPHVGCADAPWLPFVLGSVRRLVTPPTGARRAYITMMLGLVTAIATLVIALATQAATLAAISAVSTALVSCAVSSLVGVDLREGYDHFRLALWKSAAKAQTAFAVVLGFSSTLVIRSGTAAAVTIVVVASLASVAAALTADLRVGWAEATSKTGGKAPHPRVQAEAEPV